MPPSRRFAVLTDVDMPFELVQFVGLAEGDPHMIQSAERITSDASVASLVASHKQLGTRDWYIVRQIDSAFDAWPDDIMHGFLAESLNEGDATEAVAASAGDQSDWLTLSDTAAAVAAEVQRIRGHPDVPVEVRVHGYLYDRSSARLIRVDV